LMFVLGVAPQLVVRLINTSTQAAVELLSR
jgi:hypothetical protein